MQNDCVEVLWYWNWWVFASKRLAVNADISDTFGSFFKSEFLRMVFLRNFQWYTKFLYRCRIGLRWNYINFIMRYTFSSFSTVYKWVGNNRGGLCLRLRFYNKKFFSDHWLIRPYLINIMINGCVHRTCSCDQIAQKFLLRTNFNFDLK